MHGHYIGIIAGYAAATALVWLLWLAARTVIAAPERVAFQRPWLEVGLVVVAAAMTIGVGQAYMRGLLLADEGVALRTANQALIFAPLLLLLLIRQPGPRGAGLPFGRPMLGLLIGLGLAGGAVALYAIVRGFDMSAVFASVIDADNIPHAAQVLFEDIAVAALLLRMGAAIGGRWSIGVVAALFAAAHIPAMLANGVAANEFAALLLDTGVGVMLLGGVLATRSIWWLWPLHTAMDLTQFYEPA